MTETVALIECDAAHKHPLLRFREGILKSINGQWSQVNLEQCSLEPFNEDELLVCHVCGFVFDKTSLGAQEHALFHAKSQKSP
jgi:hypothetical protein